MNRLKIFYEKNQPHLVKANSLLMILIILFLVVAAFLPEALQDLMNKALLTAIYFTSIFALASRSQILFPVAIFLTLDEWTAKIAGIELMSSIASLLNALFFIYVVIKLVRQFAQARDVTAVVILGSINGYLLLGLVFALFAGVVAWIYPGAYFDTHAEAVLTFKDSSHVYFYYVFITMATVGYGDIIPICAASQALAVLIAVTGQLYIAVVIAFLVGKFAGIHLAGRTKNHGGET